MTVEEYLELIGGMPKPPKLGTVVARKNRRGDPVVKRVRSGKKDPKMAKALRKANQIGRTKAGKLRKGYTQAKIMKKAHQLRRKM